MVLDNLGSVPKRCVRCSYQGNRNKLPAAQARVARSVSEKELARCGVWVSQGGGVKESEVKRKRCATCARARVLCMY